MIMTIENKRRVLFEAWFERLNHRKPEIQYWRGGHGYSEAGADAAWAVFNAALDAVVIELPDKFEDNHGGDSHGPGMYDQAIQDCASAIKSTNLGLKVLS